MGFFKKALDKVVDKAVEGLQSKGVVKEMTFNDAILILTKTEATPVELKRAEDAVLEADETIGDGQLHIASALLKTHGRLTSATDREGQFIDAANFLATGWFQILASGDKNQISMMEYVMASNYVKTCNLDTFSVNYYVFDKEEMDGVDAIFISACLLYGWALDVDIERARGFAEDSKGVMNETGVEVANAMLRLIDEVEASQG